MVYRLAGLSLLLLLLPTGVLAANTTFVYHCPVVACTNQYFTVWVDYKYNESTILNASVIAGAYNLSYSDSYDRYQESFNATSAYLWEYNVSANSPFDDFEANCSTNIVNCINITIKLWEEQELKTYAGTEEYIITEPNYDKQMNDPYINDFAYIIARNEDRNGTDAYEYCHIPFGSTASLLGMLNIGDWLGANTTSTIENNTKSLVGCEDYWFRAEYNNGEALLRLPFIGNYTLYLLDGVITWENEVSPPKITKSDLNLPLGRINVEEFGSFTSQFWISHAELDFWGSFTDSAYPFIILLIPFLLFVFLIISGVSLRTTIGVILLWIIIWTIVRML